MVIEQLIGFFAPWKALYEDSKAVPAITQSVHLLGMLIGGGLAIASDRTTLRARSTDAGARAEELEHLHQIHRPVVIALFVITLSGLALAAADFETFITSPAFWVKIGLVVLLLGNGLLFMRTETRLRRDGSAAGPRLWGRLRFNAICSITLWCATLVAGAVLVNAA